MIDIALYCYWYTGESKLTELWQGQRERAPAENAEVAFGSASLFEVCIEFVVVVGKAGCMGCDAWNLACGE